MLDVNVEKILPITAVRDALNKIIDEVEGGDQLYVVTKNGKPAAIIVGVHHLEKLTGIHHKEIMPDELIPAEEVDTTKDIPVATSIDDVAKPAVDNISAAPSQAPVEADNVPSQTEAPIDDTPLSDQTQSPQTDESDFDDLFSAPEATTPEPVATSPQTLPVPEPAVTAPVANQPAPQEGLQPLTEAPLQPQSQPVQQTTETFAIPASTPQDNIPVANTTTPQPQANQTNLQQ